MTTAELIFAPGETPLHKNPFYVIGATTRDTRARILELADESGLVRDAEECREAQGILITPRKRLAAELSWLPGVAPRKASQLVARIQRSDLGDMASELPPLAQANVLAAYIERLGESTTALDAATAVIRLAQAVQAIDLPDVLRDINEDRAVAGFTPERDVETLAEIFEIRKRGYKASIISQLDRLSTKTVIGIIDVIATRSTADGTQPAPELIQHLVESYELDAQTFIEGETGNIEKLIARARKVAPSSETVVVSVIEEIERVVNNYLSVVWPIQIVKRTIGLTHAPSRDLAYRIRSLSVDLHNDHGYIDAPTRLTEFLRERFAPFDEVVEKVEEDDAFLKDAVHKTQQSELERQEFEREITYNAEVGILFKDRIEISPQGVTWKGSQIPLEAITRTRWGGTRNSINGIPTGTDFLIMVGNKSKTINMTMRDKRVYGEVIDRLWRAVGVRLLVELVAQLRRGASVQFGDAVVRDSGVSLVRHKFWGANERVELSWNDVQVWSRDGNFIIGAKNDSKVYVALPYQGEDNIHVLENLIRFFFKKPGNKISQIFD